MSKCKVAPLDFAPLHPVPLAGRPAKVGLEHFGTVAPAGVSAFVDSLPRLLGAEQFRGLAAAILAARSAGRAILWGLGGHVVKCGLAPVLIGLMDRGLVTGLAVNGGAGITVLE